MGWVGWSPRETQGGMGRSHRPVQLRNWPCGGRAQHRQGGAYLQTALEGANKGTMAAVPPALAPVPHNLVFPHMSLVSPELLTLCRGLG